MSLIRFVLQHSRTIVILSLFAGIISGASNAALLAVINSMLKGNGVAVGSLVVVFVGLCTLLPLSRFVSEVLLNSLGQGALYTLRVELIRQMLAAPLRHLEQLGSHRMLAALTDDVPLISASILAIPLLCINTTIVIGCLIYMGIMSPLLFAIVLAFMVLGIVTYQFPVVQASQVLNLAAADGDRLIGHFRALIQGTKELKSHRKRRQAFVDELVAPTASSLRSRNLKAMKIYSAASSWGQTLVFVVIGLIVLILPRMQHMSAATLTGYALALIYLMMPLQVIMNMLPTLARANVAIKKTKDLGLELTAKGADEGVAAESPRRNWRELKFGSVVHSYQREGDASDFVLGPINLGFGPGQTVFIIGGNGSGKTTLIKLLTGLYVPQGGTILLDGEAIEAEATDEYRQYFSVVFADFFLFEQLLGLAAPALDDQARRYLGQLRLADKVRIDNGKFSTVDLSQGQRKRLALLTAFLEDRPIYVFDEWAADQDPYFKKIFYLQLIPELKARGKTVFVVSHDDRYYHLADRIIRLEDGRLVSDTLKVDHQALAEATA